MSDLPEGRLLELVHLVIDRHGSRIAKVLCRRHRDDRMALARTLAAAAGVGVERETRAHRDRDQVTVLTGRGRAGKVITPTGIGDYNAGRWFGVATAEAGGIAELARLLGALEVGAPRSFVIRAKLIEGRDPARVRRLLYADPKTGEGPYFEPCPRRWVGLDFDSFVLPAGVDPVDLEAVAALAAARLPEPYQGASYWAQLTAGAGLKPGGRVRLFYWFSRPTSGAEMKRWLKAVPGLDTSTLNDVTPNYVAKPLFVGVRDPVPVRSRLIAGEVDIVIVPALSEPKGATKASLNGHPAAEARPYAAPERGLGFRATRAERYMLTCVRAVADAGPGEGRDTCTRVALRLYGLCKSGLLDAADVTGRLKGAMLHAQGWSADQAKRGRTLADVNRQLQWAWDHAEPRGLNS